MNFKTIFAVFVVSVFFFYYTIVNSGFYKNTEVSFFTISSKNIYLNSGILDNVIVVFNSNDDISNYKIHSNCETKTQFLYKLNSSNFFNLKVLEKGCFNENFYLKDEKGNVLSNTHFKLNLVSDFELYNKFTDYNDELLALAKKKYLSQKDKFKLFAFVDNTNPNFDFIKKSRHYSELDYQTGKIEEILLKRNQKYLIPIVGYQLPDGKNPSKLPNSFRPYRADYTNAVHEGWDIDAPMSTKIISIDDGIIIKIVNDFNFSDLEKIQKGDNLSYAQKVKNLDILRGNQVWLKTMKGDVIFYSHLDKVNYELKVGDKINRGQYIGNVGITGVPDKNYTDYHLHFELRKNPYLKENAGNNTLEDYMNWDWYFAGESKEYILKNQYNIFQY